MKMICKLASKCPFNGQACEGTHSQSHNFVEGICNSSKLGDENLCPDCVPMEKEFDNLEVWDNNCGMDIVYNEIRLGYERHMARDLYRELGKLIKRWDKDNSKAIAKPKVICPLIDKCPSDGRGCEGTHYNPHSFKKGSCNQHKDGKEYYCPDCIPVKIEKSKECNCSDNKIRRQI